MDRGGISRRLRVVTITILPGWMDGWMDGAVARYNRKDSRQLLCYLQIPVQDPSVVHVLQCETDLNEPVYDLLVMCRRVEGEEGL